MPQTFLGIVERFGPGKAKPGARLRPIFQVSADKMRWEKPEDDFPNSGVVSWWQPAPDADVFKAWMFQVEPSWTYDSAVEHHDYYGVKGSPVSPVELIDLSDARDPEDVRSLLLEEGIPLDYCASKRLVFRDCSGFIVGPLELTIRDRRLFLEAKDTYIALSREKSGASLAVWHGHNFLPPENFIHRVGEVDFSSNSVFLRRVLREIREIPLAEVERAKLTVKMIGEYAMALEKTSVTPFQAHRLKRLHKLVEGASNGIALGEDALPDLLSLPPVREVISAAADRAAKSAIDERQAALTELDTRRVDLEERVRDLTVEEERWQTEIAALHNQQAELLAGFDRRIQEKFKEIGQSATSFLSEVALIRAALFPAVAPSVRQTAMQPLLPKAEPLQAAHLTGTFRRRFEDSGLGCIMQATLLSSWTSGYVPMLFGVSARDALLTAATTLFGGCAHFVAMGPTYSSPGEISSLPTTSPFSVGTVGEIVAEAMQSENLALLVFDNVNMSQIDSLLMPLLRSYVAVHGSSAKYSSRAYPTAAGMWPSNLLLAGILIDSPLALPLSTELWACATFIDASCGAGLKSAEQDNKETPLQRVNYEGWLEWGRIIEMAPTDSDTDLLATHCLRRVDGSSLFRAMLRRLASAIDMTASTLEDVQRAAMLAEVAVVPYMLSRGIEPDGALRNTPVDISTEVRFVDTVTKLFQKWGLKINREP